MSDFFLSLNIYLLSKSAKLTVTLMRHRSSTSNDIIFHSLLPIRNLILNCNFGILHSTKCGMSNPIWYSWGSSSFWFLLRRYLLTFCHEFMTASNQDTQIAFIRLLRFHKWVSLFTLHKKWSFPLRTYLVNVSKSAVSFGFGHIYWRYP